MYSLGAGGGTGFAGGSTWAGKGLKGSGSTVNPTSLQRIRGIRRGESTMLAQTGLAKHMNSASSSSPWTRSLSAECPRQVHARRFDQAKIPKSKMKS